MCCFATTWTTICYHDVACEREGEALPDKHQAHILALKQYLDEHAERKARRREERRREQRRDERSDQRRRAGTKKPK